MKKRKPSLADALLTAIQADERSVLQLAKDAGVPQSALSRFVLGERGLTLATASKVAAELGLELRPVKKGSEAP